MSTYYVNGAVTQSGDGSEKAPFRTIQEAANVAVAGDTVLVLPGIYRENVNPIHAGEENARIIYRSVEPLKAKITGAELVTNWENVEGTVWKASVDNAIFGDFNPYTTLVSGDWFIATFIAHVGDVYLNGKSLYEVTELEKVKNPEVFRPSWDPDFTVYTWYSEQDEAANKTVFYANFQGKNPNEECVEISARPACFYPVEEGVGYITLDGFTVCQAATQWAPPTAYQEGMIGPHWSKGWVIENCEIYESKCSGISLGKYKQPTNDNKWLKTKFKDGTQTERECICLAQIEGWTKERIGSHVVRNCHIHDCGQTGIVGHLGGVFSVIENNHIHHINNKQNLAGAEIGGIKMHAAIDVVYRRNHIHHCTRGIWLDWQAQGTRVTECIFHDNTLPNVTADVEPYSPEMQGNGEDIFIEVSHGPTLLDHNVFLSTRALKLATQGVAVVHNLIGGSITAVGTGTDNGAKTLSSPRYTPYHVQHRTEVAGFMTFLHGDMRFYNNIFFQQEVYPAFYVMEKNSATNPNGWDTDYVHVGTDAYNGDGYMTYDEWVKEFDGYCGMGSPASDRYYMHLPVWSDGNVYFNGAKAWEKEVSPLVDEVNKLTAEVVETAEGYELHTNAYEFANVKKECVTTERLGMAFEPEQYYENPDGSPIVLNDLLGQVRETQTLVGPFATPTAVYKIS